MKKPKSTDTRATLLDMTLQLVAKEGYAAVSTRRVAREVGLTPALVHYYFPTTDDLFIAAYRRVIDEYDAEVRAALAAARPLHALWKLDTDPTRTVLAVEFMALTNHRKAIRTELAQHIDVSRKARVDATKERLNMSAAEAKVCSPAAVAMLMAGMTRAFVMENAMGVSYGHSDTAAFVKWCLDRWDKPAKGRPRSKSKTTKPRT